MTTFDLQLKMSQYLFDFNTAICNQDSNSLPMFCKDQFLADWLEEQEDQLTPTELSSLYEYFYNIFK